MTRKTSARESTATPVFSPSSHADDAELLERLQRGDSAALEKLIQKYRTFLLSLINKYIPGDQFLAEDILQEAWISVARNPHGFNAQKGNFAAWIVTIIRRRSIDEIRKNRSRSRGIEKFALYVDNTESETGQAPATETPYRGVSGIIATAIEKLPAEQKELVRLYMLGHSQQSIASETRTPKGTVKTRYNLAMKKIKGSLARIGITCLEMAA